MAKKAKTRTMYRSAKTGRTVSKSYAKNHPATTEKETRKVSRSTGGTGPRRKKK
jgi:hypothetical protein